MLSNADVLAKFGNWLSPGDISRILPRLLRIPEAWDQIHDPDFIEQILNERVEENLLLSNLVRIQNQHSAAQGDCFATLEELDSELEELVKKIEALPPDQRSFKHVAVLSHYILKFMTSDHEGILGRIINAPTLWRSAFACSWSEIGDMSILPTTLLHSNRDEDVLIVVNAMIANLEVEQAAQTLLAISGGTLPHNLFPLISSREPQLVQRVIALASSQEKAPSDNPSGQTLSSMLLDAYIARQNQEYETASAILHDAQNSSNRTYACISDQCAEIAKSLDDHELELQARENAARYETSPQRRASLALLLLKMDRLEQSGEALDSETGSLEEKIVLGLLNAQKDNADQAHTNFAAAVEGLATQSLQDIGWTRILIDELIKIGDSATALKVAVIRNQVLGADSRSKVEYARFLLEVGDPLSAAQNAHIAYALSPQSIDAREILAEALQESDSPAEALAHWNALSETDNSAILSVARCALEAGFIDLAIHTADSLLTNDTYASDAHLIIGEAYRSNGDLTAAKEYFESVTQENSQNAKAWIALAECLETLGDREAAGHTIRTAIQMNPSDAHLLHAQALWLEGEGRLSEALQAVESAYGLDPKGFDIQITYGDLLRQLGHHEKSLIVLKEAIAQKPYHWKSLNVTAQVQAELGEYEDALSTISNLPQSAAPQAHTTAGELTIRAAHRSQDVDLAIKGVGHLEFAIKAGVDNPRIHHWLGVAYETSEEFEKAYDAYQASLKKLPDEEYELILDSKVGLGRSALAIGQTTLATSILEDAHKRNQKSISTLVALSQAYLQSQKKGKAFQAAEHALDIDPSDRRAIQQITKVAKETNNWSLAMGAMKKVVDRKPLDPSSWIIYAEAASFAKHIPEARKALAQALMHGRSDPNTLVGAATVMIDLDLPHSATRSLQRAIQIEPDNATTYQALAHAAEMTGDMATAQRAWSMCVELDPTDITTLEKAAEAHWHLGLRAGALDLWEAAHRIDPEYTPLHFTLASAHVAQGDNALGVQYLLKASKKNPDNINLAVECAKLAIDFGEAACALSVLEGILRKAPTRNDVLLTLAEAYLALSRNQKASQVLGSIIIEPTPPDCWHAISTLAAHQEGENKHALTYYKAGCDRDEISSRDRILMSDAALALGRWDEALELTDHKKSDAVSWQLNLARANVRIRIHELSEIFKIADVVIHNPSTALSEEETLPSIDDLIDAAMKDLAPKQYVEVAKLRSALATHSLDSNLWNDALLTLQSSPSSNVLEALAIASLRSGNHQETLETIALRDDLGIESKWLDILAGISQHSLGQFSAAHKSFQRAERNSTLLPLSQYLSAKSLITLEERDSAIDHLKSAVGIWSEEEKWQFQLGKLLALDGNLDLALPHLQDASELAPSNYVYRMTLAKALKQSGHISQAYEYYQIAIHENPSDGVIWLEAGQLALGMGELSQAEQYFEQACELLPSEPIAFTGAAKTALAKGNPKSAMQLARTAMRLAPEEPDVLVVLGEILAQQGKIEKALQSFDLAIPKLENPLPLRIARARLLAQLKQSSKAIEEMKALTELNPENEEIWAGYAEICEELNNLAEGVEAANKASKLAPNNPGYHLLFARLCRKSGQLDRALAELSKLEQKNPTNAKVLTELGILYEERRQYTEALDAFQRSIACNGNSSIPYLRAGVVLKHLKIYAQSGDMLSKAVELNPQDHEALHQLAAVRALELVHGGIRKMAVTT